MCAEVGSIIAHLQSSKVKDRNDALQRLELSLEHKLFLENIARKQVTLLVEGLYATISIDAKALSSGRSTSAVELRIVTAAKIIRKLISKSLHKLKPSQAFRLIWLLEAFLNDFVAYHTIAVEGARTLALITSKHLFIASAKDGDYSKLIKCLIRFINLSLDNQPSQQVSSQQFVQQLLEALHHSFSSSQLPSHRLCLFDNSNELLLTISDCIHKYINVYQEASLGMVSIFKISNCLISCLCVQQVKPVQRLMIRLMQIIPLLKLYSYASLKDSVLVFLIFAGDCILNYQNVPKPVHIDEEPHDLCAIIVNVIEVLDSQIINARDHLFDLSEGAVDFYDNNLHLPHISHWFKLKYIFLNPQLSNIQTFGSEQRAWLSRLALVKLLYVYHHVSNSTTQTRSPSDDSMLRPFKKRKVSLLTNKQFTPDKFSITEIIKGSEGFSHVLTSLFNDGQKELACQLFIFYSSICNDFVVDTHLEKFINLILSSLDDTSSLSWSLLTIKVFVEHLSHQFDCEDLIRVAKVCFQSVKTAPLSSVACSTLITILNHVETNNDWQTRLTSSLRQTVHSVLDMAEINGPALLNNHSILFYFKIHKVFSNLLVSGNLLMWLLHKSDDIASSFRTNYYLLVDLFFIWLLSSRSVTITVNNLYGSECNAYHPSLYENYFMHCCILWNSSSEIRNNLFLVGGRSEQTTLKAMSVEGIMVPHNGTQLTEKLFTKWYIATDQLITEMSSGSLSSFEMYRTKNVLTSVALKLLSVKFNARSSHFPQFLTLEFKVKSILDTVCSGPQKDLSSILELINQFLETQTPVAKQFFEDWLERIFELSNQTLQSSVYSNTPSLTPKYSNTPSLASTDSHDNEIGRVRRAEDNYEKHSSLQNFMLKSTTRSLSKQLVTLYMNVSDKPLLKILQSFDAQQLLDCYEPLQTHAKDAFQVIPRLIGEQLLALSYLESNEVALCCICKLCAALAPYCLVSDNASDLVDIFNYMVELYRMGAMKTQNTMIEFQKLVLIVLPLLDKRIKVPTGSLSSRPGIVAAMETNCNYVKLKVAKAFSFFYESLSVSKREEAYKLVFSTFDTPQQSSESFFTFGFFISETCVTTNYTTASCMFNLLEFCEVDHAKPYIESCLALISKTGGFSTNRQLFCHYKLELLSFWHLLGSTLLNFPFNVFHYANINDFVNENYQTLVGILTSSRNPEQGLKQVASIRSSCGKTESSVKQIVFESIPLAISLAFASGGIRNGLFTYLSNVFKKECSDILAKWLPHTIVHILERTNSEAADDEEKLATPVVHISPKTSKLLIDTLISNYSDTNTFWDVNVVYYITSAFILSLYKSRDIKEKQWNMKRLRMVVKMVPSTVFSHFSLLKLVVYGITPFFSEPFLQRDISWLLLYVTSVSKLAGRQSFVPIIIKIGIHLAKYSCQKLKEAQTIINYPEVDQLKEWLISIRSNYSFGKGTVEFSLMETLAHPEAHIPQMTEEYLEKIIKVSLPEYCVEELVPVLVDSSKVSCFQTGRKSDPSVAQFLIKIKHQDTLPLKFLVWKARYLGRFYADNGTGFPPFKPRKSLGYLQTFVQKQKISYLMSLIFYEIKRWLRDLHVEDSSILIKDTIGALLWLHENDNRQLDMVCEFLKLFGEYLSYILPLDPKIFALLYPPCLTFQSVSLDNFVENVEQLYRGGFDIWCTELLLSVCQELEQTLDYIEPLKILACHSPSYSKKITTYLIVFYIDGSSNTGAKLIGKIVSTCLEKFDNEDMMMFLMDLCLSLRIGYKSENKKFLYVFRHEYYIKLYRIACDLKLWKIALLFYESFIGELGAPNSLVDYKSLEQIYYEIDEEDIKYSMPVLPSLDYAVDLVNGGQDSLKKMMFSSALFESNLHDGSQLAHLNSNSADPEVPAIIQSLLSAGLTGLSSLVGSFYDTNGNSKDKYRWAWKLNQWDLPIKDSTSLSMIIYKALKHKVDHPESFNPEEAYMEALQWRSLEVNEQEYNKGWDNEPFNLLSILYNMELIFHQHGCVSSQMFPQLNPHSWLYTKKFKHVETLLEARQAAFTIVANSTKNDEVQLSKIVELHSYGKLARLSEESQKSMNATMKIKKIVAEFLPSNTSDLYPFANAVAQFDFAAALWQQSEALVAITMMKGLKAKFPLKNDPLDAFVLNEHKIDSYLVEWLHKSKQGTSASIVSDYIESYFNNDISAHSLATSKMHHTFAQFCEHQLRTASFDADITRYEKLIHNKNKELKEVSMLQGTEAKRYAYKLKKQLITDSNQLKSLKATKSKFIQYSVYFYLKSILEEDEFNDSDVDRFCALWLKYSDETTVNQIVRQLVFGESKYTQKLASYKLLGWVSQLSSRLSVDSSEFQTLLQSLLLNASLEHPYHTLYILKSLRLQTQFNSNPDAIMKSRSVAANELWIALLNTDRRFGKEYLSPVDFFCDESVNLANYEISGAQKKILLDNIVLKSFWLERLPTLNVVLPTREIPVKKNHDYSSCPTITSISPTIEISSSGISRPKIAVIRQSDGFSSKVLFKGNTDDLRQDAIMEQVFEKVNILLSKDKEASQRRLKMRTYKVIPLGPQAGMIEFVLNSMPLIEIIYPLHSKHDPISHSQAAKKMQQWESLTAEERIKNFQDRLCLQIKPVLREFFFKNFLNPYDWFDSRVQYSRGTAACSMVGYILGLGDRHCNNILIDKQSGEPVHIDLGVAFDQGKLLTIPETVPFRLTRDIIDGMGVSGVEGLFRKSCEHVFRVLRERKDQIHGILDILKWDPLYMWTISPLRKRKLQDRSEDKLLKNVQDEGFEASRAVSTVQEKLVADDLSVEAVVRQLILEASDTKNLALLFRGWAPFY